MESISTASDEQPLDPISQLEMLQQVQNATEVDGWIPPTPVWHAPLLAATIISMAIVSSGDPEGWRPIALVVGAIALTIGLGDQIRRQRVMPRRLTKPLRVVAFYLFIFLVTLAISIPWFNVEWPAGTGARLVWLIGGWVLTTAIFALGVFVGNRVRNQWAGAPR